MLDITGAGRATALRARRASTTSALDDLRHAAARHRAPEGRSTFDYAILDEAQAIKNARTSSAKAARLLTADHRLALSGTPIENHLGELWSLFEFLNPGMLGAASVFPGAGRQRAGRRRWHAAAARARLRPFILRRTKEQVAASCRRAPSRRCTAISSRRSASCTTSCATHYRAALLGSGRARRARPVEDQILEALLRLRQAACHPGWSIARRPRTRRRSSTCLLPQLQELVEDGHKVLVFSQFTSLLALLRDAARRRRT